MSLSITNPTILSAYAPPYKSRKVRRFSRLPSSEKQPYSSTVEGEIDLTLFAEYSGNGAPVNPPQFGIPGDLYVEVNANGQVEDVYGMTMSGWTRSTSAVGPTRVIHPMHSDTVIWRDGESFGWVPTKMVKTLAELLKPGTPINSGDRIENTTEHGRTGEPSCDDDQVQHGNDLTQPAGGPDSITASTQAIIPSITSESVEQLMVQRTCLLAENERLKRESVSLRTQINALEATIDSVPLR